MYICYVGLLCVLGFGPLLFLSFLCLGVYWRGYFLTVAVLSCWVFLWKHLSLPHPSAVSSILVCFLVIFRSSHLLVVPRLAHVHAFAYVIKLCLFSSMLWNGKPSAFSVQIPRVTGGASFTPRSDPVLKSVRGNPVTIGPC